jgi:type IV pilus assembly protein PilB
VIKIFLFREGRKERSFLLFYLYEVFEISEEIQNLILKRATSSEIQKLAQSQGMITMREDGYLKALAGMTTISEVNRVAAEDAA